MTSFQVETNKRVVARASIEMDPLPPFSRHVDCITKLISSLSSICFRCFDSITRLFFSVCSPTSVICFRTVQYCIFFVNADVCGGVEPVPQELHPSILRLAFLLPLFTVESAAANRHLPVDAPVFRLRRHDDHSAQLHLPGHDGACRTSRVSTHKIINNYYIPPSLKSRRNQQIS